MIEKRFGCTTIHNKALYKYIIQSFILFKCVYYLSCKNVVIIFWSFHGFDDHCHVKFDISLGKVSK